MAITTQDLTGCAALYFAGLSPLDLDQYLEWFAMLSEQPSRAVVVTLDRLRRMGAPKEFCERQMLLQHSRRWFGEPKRVLA